MKKSLICSLQKTGIADYIFDGEPEKNLFTIQELGYEGVELAVRQPWTVDLGWLNSLLEQTGLEVCNTGTSGVAGEGLFLTSPAAADRRACLEHLKQYVRFAASIGGSLSIGTVRGPAPVAGASPAEQRRWLAGGLRELAKFAGEEFDLRLVVEPLGPQYTGWIRTVAEALELLDEIDAGNLGLLVDTYHLYHHEPGWLESLAAAGSRVAHVHVSDSNRRCPGMGVIDFRAVIKALRAIGYDGYLSLEAEPYPDPITCAKNNAEYLAAILSEGVDQVMR